GRGPVPFARNPPLPLLSCFESAGSTPWADAGSLVGQNKTATASVVHAIDSECKRRAGLTMIAPPIRRRNGAPPSPLIGGPKPPPLPQPVTLSSRSIPQPAIPTASAGQAWRSPPWADPR